MTSVLDLKKMGVKFHWEKDVAKSDKSKCKFCKTPIKKGEPRLGYTADHDGGGHWGLNWGYFKPACAVKAGNTWKTYSKVPPGLVKGLVKKETATKGAATKATGSTKTVKKIAMKAASMKKASMKKAAAMKASMKKAAAMKAASMKKAVAKAAAMKASMKKASFTVPAMRVAGRAGKGGNERLAKEFAQMSRDAFGAKDAFKGRAYAKVARVLRACPYEITSEAQAAKLEGIGKSSAKRIGEMLK